MESLFEKTLREARERTAVLVDQLVVEPGEWSGALGIVTTKDEAAYGILRSVNMNGVAYLEINREGRTLIPAFVPMVNVMKLTLAEEPVQGE